MKKATSIFLLLCLVLPLVGTYAFLELEKKKVKRAVKWKMIEGIAKEELVLLTFHKKDIQAVLEWKHSKEFSYKNEMYDIARSEEKSDSILYYCWWDHEETLLNKQLASLLDDFIGNNPANKDQKEKVTTFYKELYCSTKVKENAWYYKGEEGEIIYTKLMVSRYSVPTSPPPQSVAFFFKEESILLC